MFNLGFSMDGYNFNSSFSKPDRNFPHTQGFFLHCIWECVSAARERHTRPTLYTLPTKSCPMQSIITQLGNTRQKHSRGICIAKTLTYIMGQTLKFLTDHSAVNYLVNKPVLEGYIVNGCCFRCLSLKW